MFLNELNIIESKAFVNLVRELANLDEIFAKEEEKLIEEYIDELTLRDQDIEKQSLEEIKDVFNSSTDRIKKIVFFELIGLALVDGEFEHKEEVFLKELAHDFNISFSRMLAFVDFFRNIKSVYDFTVVDYESKIKLIKEYAERLVS
ncbi:hypothetical protein [Clostridium paridis]|uniref:Co-chaperone DjlA N-terminal domain-containing protein n=1 Tax=Clostridium paridis TaxID=2803863 RepID=A0A937FDE2_9CLOT|nr:hypothetical protein [Clostridium paridis]MBL4930760.1 hypothetical protein [Clostridium paridis]